MKIAYLSTMPEGNIRVLADHPWPGAIESYPVEVDNSTGAHTPLKQAMRAVEALEGQDMVAASDTRTPRYEAPRPSEAFDGPANHPVFDKANSDVVDNRLHVYLAGPMSGIPEFNYPLFNAAAVLLRARGYRVFSPAEHDKELYGKDISNPTGSIAQATTEQGFSLREALAADLKWICESADAIALLPGWENSKGARTEHALAVALDLKRIYLE